MPALFFFTDERRTPDPVALIKTLPKGCGVIFRHYDVVDRSDLARHVVLECRAQGRMCLIAGDVKLALLVGADGLHFSEHMLEERKAIPRADENWISTAAVHSAKALESAVKKGADAVFLSPVFPTASHPKAEALGSLAFAGIVTASDLPVYALGGVTTKTAPQLLSSGAVGIGAIGALLP